MRKSVFDALVATIVTIEQSFKDAAIKSSPAILELLTPSEYAPDTDEGRTTQVASALILVLELDATFMRLIQLLGSNDELQEANMELYGLVTALSQAALTDEYVEQEDDEVEFSEAEQARETLEVAG